MKKSRSLYYSVALLLCAGALSRVAAQTVEDRITKILSTMSIGEKILQLNQDTTTANPDRSFMTATNTRLGIPGFMMSDGPHGVRWGMATSFPVGIGMASTWDTALVRRIGVAMGEEFRGKGREQGLGPAMDLDRDPRNGRSPETGGEDPFLCARITTAAIQGMQSTGAIATAKHYNGNNRENGRTSNNVTVSKRMLMEHYGIAFRSAVQEGGVFSVMNAYNLINGQYCGENPTLLKTILKQAWGFPYYVVSDWGSLWHTQLAINGGCDLCMGADNYARDLPGLVQGATVATATIDEAVRRVLRTKILAGKLDYAPAADPMDVNSPAHQQLCLEAGRKSLVLLKNTGHLLPLSKSIGSIAMIGPSANVCQVDGSGSATVTPFHSVSPRAGVEAKIGTSKVLYVKGCDINSADTSTFNAARIAASNSDVVIYCGGLDGTQEGEGFDRVGGSTALPGKQQDLITTLASVNKNMIVVLYSGGICSIERCSGSIASLIYAFYPGQESGNALADVLFGDVNPAGKLPVTMPLNDAQLPPWGDSFGNYNYGDYGTGYRWFDHWGYKPLYAFGAGLSYTTFAYTNPAATPSTINPGEPVTIAVDITNTGTRAGEEVAQLYLSYPSPVLPMPVKQLRGFSRVAIDPGATVRVSFVLTPDELYSFDESTDQYRVFAGTYNYAIGGQSDSLAVTGSFTITSAAGKPDLRVLSVKMVPPYPLPGDSVIFLATVKNQGSASTPVSATVGLAFSVNGVPVATSDEFTSSIPAGGMALICGNKSVAGSNRWRADTVGTYAVTALVNPDGSIDEISTSNNTASIAARVYPTPPVNLALHKTVTVSSVEAAAYGGANAVDGNLATRWSSAFSDPQSLVIDLGDQYSITQIVLNWETAYGKEYLLQVSANGVDYTTLMWQTNGAGGVEKYPVSAIGRYVKVFGLKRSTVYGYSLWEVEVYGSLITGVGSETKTTPVQPFSLSGNYPNPFNPATSIRYHVSATRAVRVEIFDLLGRKIAILVDEVKRPGDYMVSFDASGLASGVYLCRMEAGSFVETRKLVLIR